MTDAPSNLARPSTGLWLAWGVATATAALASVFFGSFLAAFLRPHAFGGRDGQGAAGLAAVLLFVSLALAVVAEVVALLLARRLGQRGRAWAFPAALAAAGTGSVVGVLLGALG